MKRSVCVGLLAVEFLAGAAIFGLVSYARSADWITAEYNNQLSPTTFYSTVPQ